MTEKLRVCREPGLGHVWHMPPDEELGIVLRCSKIGTTVESLNSAPLLNIHLWESLSFCTAN